ncbi:MAG: translation elongation factor EF-1 subunit alpha [Candidatus Methanomethylicia archaeon]|nr:translation elongation factor EF-1 subunit alpha [Candidatus Methanomethylicia archaeon]MCX8169273.1 translation elongation factor EF-1 subunit alpha [Candidatus Methanomethylicia archaeon]MDW7988945.1 translation elongation factor EF-1 subunit alpha [Nitrososphaerota archaeon]
MSEKPHLNLVIIGHVDHGKSTTMGHLLYLTGNVDERTMKMLEEESEKIGKGSFKYAWVLDKLKEERERGLTIDVSFWKFETPKYYFTIIDAPGHRDFVKNMITGASQADTAVLVVSAKRGEYEAGMGAAGQTREHAFLAKTLGIDQLIVIINKMDDPTVNYSKERFEEVKTGVTKFLRMIGYDLSKVPVIPVSGWYGDNLVVRSDKMPWYNGPTLVEALDQFKEPPRPVDKPLRIPIQDVYTISGVGTVPVGRVETGVLNVGDTVLFLPVNKKGEVRSIEMHHQPLRRAIPGDNIGFNIRGVAKEDLRRGHVCCHTENPVKVAKSFIGRIYVLYHPTAIASGYTPVLHIHTATVAIRFDQLLKKIDPRSGATIEENPTFLKQGDAAIVKFVPLKPICMEKYAEIPQLGRFAIRDMGRTVAAGIVMDIEE